jgi:hypothetical protein
MGQIDYVNIYSEIYIAIYCLSPDVMIQSLI